MDALAAALDAVHARQQRLARGDARPMTQQVNSVSSLHARLSPPGSPASRSPERKRRRPRAIVWVAKPVQHWSADGTRLQNVGMLEFLQGATLADVRGLVDQFYPFPLKRPYEFHHPTRHERIDPSDEVNVDPANLDVLALVALPLPPAESNSHAPRPLLPLPNENRRHAAHAEESFSTFAQVSKAMIDTRWSREPSKRALSNGASSKSPLRVARPGGEIVLRNQRIRDTVECDLAAQELENDNLELQVRVLSSELEDRSTKFHTVTGVGARHIRERLEETGTPLNGLLFDKLASKLQVGKSPEGGDIKRTIQCRAPQLTAPGIDVQAAVKDGRDSTESILTPRPALPSAAYSLEPVADPQTHVRERALDQEEHPYLSRSPPRHQSGHPDTQVIAPRLVTDAYLIDPSPFISDSASVVNRVTFMNDSKIAPAVDDEGLRQSKSEPVYPVDCLANVPESYQMAVNKDITFAPSHSLSDACDYINEAYVENECPSSYSCDDPVHGTLLGDDAVRPGTLDSPFRDEVIQRERSVALIRETETREESNHYNRNEVHSTHNHIHNAPSAETEAHEGSNLYDELRSKRRGIDTTVLSTRSGTKTDERLPQDHRIEQLELAVSSPRPRGESAVSSSLERVEVLGGVVAIVESQRRSSPVLKVDEQRGAKPRQKEVSSSTCLNKSIRPMVAHGVAGSSYEAIGDSDSEAVHANDSTSTYVNAFLSYMIYQFEAVNGFPTASTAHGELHEVDFDSVNGLQTSSPSALISLPQFQAAFLSYGIDHSVMALNGVLLALEEDLLAWSGDELGTVDAAFVSYVQHALARQTNEQSSTPGGFSQLQRLEIALNYVADFLAWERPSTVRLEVIESSTDISFGMLAGIAWKKGFRLSDNERSLLSRVIGGMSTNNSTDFEKWLADGLEVIYILLYHSFALDGSDKTQFLASREHRVRWVIQRMITLDPGMWRRIQLKCHVLDDRLEWELLHDRMASFRKKRHYVAKLLDTDSFLRAFVTFVSNKALQISQPLVTAIASTDVESATSMLQRFVILMNAELSSTTWRAGTLASSLRDLALEVCDLDSINKERHSRSLLPMHVSGRHSTYTHHQSQLLGSSYGLHRKARWNLDDMTGTNWYTFHGDASTVLEYVYVRHSLDVRAVGYRWEETIKFVESEAKFAFHQLTFSTTNSSRKAGVLCAVGLNALHIGLLSELDGNDSPRLFAGTFASAHSLSVGYRLSINQDFGAIRITFRFHVEETVHEPAQATMHPTANVMRAIERFMCSANDESLAGFVQFGGVHFLSQCLVENRDQARKRLLYGEAFNSTIVSPELRVIYPRKEVLFFIHCLVRIIPQAQSMITDKNLSLLDELITLQGNDGEEKLVNVTALAFSSLAGVEFDDMHSYELITKVYSLREAQKKFLSLRGLDRLKHAIDTVVPSSSQRLHLDDALFTLLLTQTLCSREALLVHASLWQKYFVEQRVWTRSSAHARLVCILLEQIHSSFFVDAFHQYDRVFCGCGCQGSSVGTNGAMKDIWTVFCHLLQTDLGRKWALHELVGPLDLIVALERIQELPSLLLSAELGELLSKSLLQLLVSTSLDHDICAVACVRVIPKAWDLCLSSPSESIKLSILEVIGLILDNVVKLSVWNGFPGEAIECLLRLSSSLPSTSKDCLLSKRMANVILHRNALVDKSSQDTQILISLLCVHHDTVINTNDEASSIFQSVMTLLRRMPPSTGIERFWRVPLLAFVCKVVEDTKASQIFVSLGAEEYLISLVVQNNPVEEAVLAGRTLTVLYFQVRWCSNWQILPPHYYMRLCKVLSISLRESGKRSFTQHQLRIHTDKSDEIMFGSDLIDTDEILSLYERQAAQLGHAAFAIDQDSISSLYGNVWDGHPWRDATGMETFITHLKLLVVFSSSSTIMRLDDIRNEVAQILRFLLAFIRDRSHVPEAQVVLYLAASTNIVAALRHETQSINLASCVDAGFCARLLVYSRRPASLLSYLASKALSTLVIAYGTRDFISGILRSPLNLVDEKQPSSQKPPGITNSVELLLSNLFAKLQARRAIEGDAASLAHLLKSDQKSAQLFFSQHSFSTIAKLLDGFRPAFSGAVRTRDFDFPRSLSAFTPHNDYELVTSALEKDMIELLHLAQSCLCVQARSQNLKALPAKESKVHIDTDSFPSLMEECAPTRRGITPLIDDHHPLVSKAAVECLLVHLASPTCKISGLIAPDDVDRMLEIGMESSYPPLQSEALAAIRAILGDSASHSAPFHLLDKLFRDQRRIVKCLKSEVFAVTKQAVELMAMLISKNDEPRRRASFSVMFREEENQAALSSVFGLLCRESQHQDEAAGVLLRIVGLVIQLDLSELIDSEILVEALTLTLAAHKRHLFLRPLVCKCLWSVAGQENKSHHFLKPSRLNTIVSLFSQSLTNGEALHIVSILAKLATEHASIRRYLSCSTSRCLAGVANLLASFSRISVGAVHIDVPLDNDGGEEQYAAPVEAVRPVSSLPDDDDERRALRVSLDSGALISWFTDEVYEELLNLVATLLAPYEYAEERHGCMCNLKTSGCGSCDPCDLFARAHGPRCVVRLLHAHRVTVRVDDTNQRMMEAPASEALTIVHLALRVLQTVSRNHQCRLDLLRASASKRGWWSVRWLVERSKPSIFERTGSAADASADTMMILSQLCAEPRVMDTVLAEHEFLLWLFTHATTVRIDAEAIRCQRSATFLLARLAEQPKFTRNPLYHGKLPSLLSQLSQCRDRVTVANLLTVMRNTRAYQYGGVLVDALVRVLREEMACTDANVSILRLLCDVLANYLLIEPKHTVASVPRVAHSGSADDESMTQSTPFTPARKSVWSRLLCKFADDDELVGFSIREPETQYIASHVWPTDKPFEDLLRFLLCHHMHTQDPIRNGSCFGIVDNDVILETSEPGRVRVYTPSLQYVPRTDEQNAAEGQDTSFSGSENLWRFVQLLWRVCAKERQLCNESPSSLPLNFVVQRFGKWISRTGTNAAVSLSRRQRLLSFVNELLRGHPEMCSQLRMKDIVGVVEGFITQSGSAQGAYELLYLMCRADSTNSSFLVNQIGWSRTRSSSTLSLISSSSTSESVWPPARLLWSAARPQYFERAVPLTRIVQRNKASGSVMHVLEPYIPPGSTAIAFSMALLDLASDISLDVLAGYLRSQSIFVLLDMLMLTVDTRDLKNQTQHKMTSSLLRLLRKCIALDSNTARHFSSDARLLYAIVRHIFSVKLPIQIAAVQLLVELMNVDSLFADRLRRLENWETSVSQVEPWMVESLEQALARLHLTNLSRKEMVEVAHLVQIPLFARVKTADLARLSVAFMESRLVEPDHFMLLAGVGHFCHPPDWMGTTNDHKEPKQTTSTAFDTTVAEMRAHGEPVLVYKMQKEWYTGGSSCDARSSIASAIRMHRAREADPRCHPAWLLNRLSRFLVEDRAELLRRVSYRQGVSHVNVAAKLPIHWNDCLRLLAESSIMEGISRDSLACLILAAGEPTVVSLKDVEKGNRDALPLMLILSERIEYTIEIIPTDSNAPAYVRGCARRGDLFGVLPVPDLRRIQTRTTTKLSKVMVLFLPDDVIRASFLPTEYETLRVHYRDAGIDYAHTRDGLEQWLEQLSGRRTQEDRGSKQAARVELQLHSLRLMEKLVRHSASYAKSLIEGSYTLSTLLHVVRSTFDRSIVDAALDVIDALVVRAGNRDNMTEIERSIVEVVQRRVQLGQDLAKPYRTLRTILEARVAQEQFNYSSELIILVSEALDCLLAEELVASAAGVKEVVDFAHALMSFAAPAMRTCSQCMLLYVAVIRTLTKQVKHVDPTTLSQLLGLAVFLDQDPMCQQAVHSHLLHLGIVDILYNIAANLAVLASTNRRPARDHIGTHLAFVSLCASHVSIAQRRGEIHVRGFLDALRDVFLEITRVLLDSFHRFDEAEQTLFSVLAVIFDAMPECAEAVVSTNIRVGHRLIHFYRHVFRRFQVYVVEPVVVHATFAVPLAKCVAVLSKTRRCIRHFVRHGLVDIAFDKLSSWSVTEKPVVHPELWTALLCALTTATVACDFPAKLLCTYSTQLRKFHSRLASAVAIETLSSPQLAATHRLRETFSACINFITSQLEQAVMSSTDIDAHSWLISDSIPQCLHWMESEPSGPQPWEFVGTENNIRLSILRFLSAVCGSSLLVGMFFSHPDVPEMLCRLSNVLTPGTGRPSVHEACTQYFCVLMEFIQTSRSVVPAQIEFNLIEHLVPAVVRLLKQPELHQEVNSETLEYALRLVWVILVTLDRQPHTLKDGVTGIGEVVTKVAALLCEPLSERAELNCLGCVSAALLLNSHQYRLLPPAFAALAEATLRMLAFARSRTQGGSDLTDHNEGDIFASRHWHCHRHSLKLEYLVMIANVLQQLVSDHEAVSAWLLRDLHLEDLYTFGLRFALDVLTELKPTTKHLLSVYTNCLIFIRASITLCLQQLPQRVSLKWRRATRRARLVGVVSQTLQCETSTPALTIECIKCLTALVKDSVVDCREISFLDEQSGVNLFESVTALTLSTKTRLDKSDTIHCLEFITTASSAVESVARLVAASMRSVKTFATDMCAHRRHDDNVTDVLAALFRCCRVLYQHGLGDEPAMLCDLVARQLCDHEEQCESNEYLEEGAQLLWLLISQRGPLRLSSQMITSTLWQRIQTVFGKPSSIAAHEAICGLVHHLIFMRSSYSGIEGLKVPHTIESLLARNVSSGETIDVALCAEWFTRTTNSSVPETICTQLSKISGLSATHQIGLVEFLPALCDLLERTNSRHLVTQNTWGELRNWAIASCNDTQKRHRMGALSVVRCLLRAKQGRVLHDAVDQFRLVCGAWQERYTNSQATATGDAAEVVVGLDTCSAVRSALGLGHDRDAVVIQALALWRASAVSSQVWDENARSTLLILTASAAIDDGGHATAETYRGVSAGTRMVPLLVQVAVHSIKKPKQMVDELVYACHAFVLALLRAPTLGEIVRRQLLSPPFDIVDQVAWAFQRYDLSVLDGFAQPLCEILAVLSVDANVAKRVFDRRILHSWIETIAYHTDSNTSPSTPEKRGYQRLTVAVTRHRSVQEGESDLSTGRLGKVLVPHTVHAIVQERLDANQFEPFLLELLTYLIQRGDDMLRELWQACLLTSNAHFVGAQATVLRALTDPMRDATTPESRRRAAFVAYALTASLRRAIPLIQARTSTPGGNGIAITPLSDLITQSLFFSVGTQSRHPIRLDSLEETTASSIFPLPLSIVACDTAMWTLRLLAKCLRDKTFTRGLWGEWDLFDQVVVSIASPNVDVSSAAAWALRDALLLQSTQRRIAVAREKLPERTYRSLSYFADLYAHDELFTVTPATSDSSPLPAVFVVVESWIRFYSHQITQLQHSPEARIHLEAVEEIALYFLIQNAPQIFIREADLEAAAIRTRLLALCEALTQIVFAQTIHELGRVRVLALELLAALCSFTTNQGLIDFFHSTEQIDKLLSLMETTRSKLERCAVLQLVREVAVVGPVKQLFGQHSSPLLSRLVRWLSAPALAELQPFATSILKQIVMRPPIAKGDIDSKKVVLQQQQQTLVVIGEALFTDKQLPPDDDHSTFPTHAMNTRVIRTVTVVARPTGMRTSSEVATGEQAIVRVILHFFVKTRKGSNLREFRYRGKVRNDRRALAHTIVLEDEADLVQCDVVLVSPRTEPTVHTLKLQVDSNKPTGRTAPIAVISDGVRIKLEAELRSEDAERPARRGIFGRLLLDATLPPVMVADAVAIVAELSKSQEVFASPVVNLGHHIIAVMDAVQRVEQRIEVAPLNALTAWFWGNRNSVSQFRSSWYPLLHVIQLLRTSRVAMTLPPTAASPVAAVTTAAPTTEPTFLASLVEWIATLESDSLTENCINVLFFENPDVLLALAPVFYPCRSAIATFFFLVSTAVRVNSLHCEIFARKHAIQMLLTLLDTNVLSSETLQHAARVLVKIARAGPATNKFLRHDGMDLFGSVAFRLLCDGTTPWDTTRQVAVDYLVLASAFLCENARVFGKAGIISDRFMGRCDSSYPLQISLIETLLLFLAHCETDRGDHSVAGSSERLAATVLRSWIEHWPGDSHSFEATLTKALEITSRTLALDDATELAERSATALRRCLELTRWDYISELHVVRASYSATVSAGVRTGVIPLVCRNAFSSFDSDLLAVELQQLGATLTTTPSTGRGESKRSRLAQDLRHVLTFVAEQEMRVQTLASNRKRTLVSRIREADDSARVATAVHAVLSVTYDAFLDALAASCRPEKRASPTPSPASASMPLADARDVVLAWLTLLEQIFGLLCCAVNEMDPVYYSEVFRQMHVLLVTELPGFLLKMERVVRREEAVHMVLANFERLLKRMANRQELRGVTAETEDVGPHADRFLAQHAQMRPKVARALALALAERDAVERVQRAIVAAEYVWRRILIDLSGGSITSFMAGTKESESLWARLRSYADVVVSAARNPGPVLYARWRRLQSLLGSLVQALSGADSPSAKASEGGRGEEHTGFSGDDVGERDAETLVFRQDAALAASLGVPTTQLVVSQVPFVSLELLLDHYSVASSGIKKQIAQLNFPELRPRVVRAFATALEVEVAVIESLSASALERALTTLHAQAHREAEWTPRDPEPHGSSKGRTNLAMSVADHTKTPSLTRLRGLLVELGSLVDENDLGIHLRVVVPRTQPLSLWQLLLTPLRRARLFSAYHHMETWGASAHRTSSSGAAAVVVPVSTVPVGSEPRTLAYELKSHIATPRWTSSVGRNKRRVAVASAETSPNDPFVELQSKAIRAIVDASWDDDDPLSEESLVASVRRKIREQEKRRASWLPTRFTRLLPASWRYSTSPASSSSVVTRWVARVRRRLALALLLLAFWRQEELERDLTNASLARAFASPAERQEYFLHYHLLKALDELSRVWMPESGSLGLPLWHARGYFVGGSLLCMVLAFAAPLLAESTRYATMTAATYTVVLAVFVCAASSMYNIAKKHFVVQQRSRLRLAPLGKYYQNALALVAVGVEVVQLNAISFDPQFNYSKTDQIPKLIQWVGSLGIAQIGVEQVELKAALCGATLVLWLVTLKCANKFQDSSAFLNRLFTKDLPVVLHGTLYMGLLSTFFSFLACVDCATATASGVKIEKCRNATTPPPAPFLISHHNIPCWTRTHAPFALLGLWGVAFFLPIGLLAQGMNQVLFAHEALDVRFAPVVTLFGQLVKALAAAARAFFPFQTTLLASVALAGNALLLSLMASPSGGASRWYLRYVKCGIYAASGWAAASAIYRVQRAAASTVATNLVYMGWLAIGGATVVAVRVGLLGRERDRRSETHITDEVDLDGSRAQEQPERLTPTDNLTAIERRFVRESALRAATMDSRQTRVLLERAAALANDEPPPELRMFMRNARAIANGKTHAHGPTAVAEAVFLQNARRLARKLDRTETHYTKQLKTD